MGDGGEVEDGGGRAELRRVALEFCRQAMRRRNKVVLYDLDQRT